jgi:hypothetical protein
MIMAMKFTIDNFMCQRAERAGYTTDPSYTPDQAVQGFRFYGEQEGNVLWGICPPWLGGGAFVNILTRTLVKSGSVLQPVLHDQIIEPNVKRVRESYRYIQAGVVDHINERARNFDEVRLAVLSLGHATLFLTAPHIEKLTRVDSVVGGAKLSDCLWEGNRTRPIRRQFEADGVAFEEIDEEWQDIGIENNAQGFNDIDINMLTASSDNIIPTSYQLELKLRFEQAGAHIKHNVNRSGHYAAAARFCLMHH